MNYIIKNCNKAHTEDMVAMREMCINPEKFIKEQCDEITGTLSDPSNYWDVSKGVFYKAPDDFSTEYLISDRKCEGLFGPDVATGNLLVAYAPCEANGKFVPRFAFLCGGGLNWLRFIVNSCDRDGTPKGLTLVP